MAEDLYELFAIRYARNERHVNRESFMPFLAQGIELDAVAPLDYFVWVARNATRTIVIDCGFDAAAAQEKGGRSLYCPIDEGLRRLGVSLDAVQDVIITHLHWDHAGNHDMFPSATYHLQGRELAYCTGPLMRIPYLRFPYNPADVSAMVAKVFAGRVRCYDGDAELAPGISLHLVGGHTPGLQVVRVRTARGWVVVATDVGNFYPNILNGHPGPLVTSLPDLLLAGDTVKALASSPQHIIPGHDPLVMAQYPRASADMPDILRLDVDPAPVQDLAPPEPSDSALGLRRVSR